MLLCQRFLLVTVLFNIYVINAMFNSLRPQLRPIQKFRRVASSSPPPVRSSRWIRHHSSVLSQVVMATRRAAMRNDASTAESKCCRSIYWSNTPTCCIGRE